jgi:hypothetical protein
MTQVVRAGREKYVFEPAEEFAGHVIHEGDTVFVEPIEGDFIWNARPVRVGEVYDVGEPSGGLPRVVGLWVAAI